MGTDQSHVGSLGKAEYEEVNQKIIDDFTAQHGRPPEPNEVLLFSDVKWNGGHLIATAMGGPGERINMVSMLESLNKAQIGGTPLNNFRSLEQAFEELLDRPDPHKVNLVIDMDYPPGRQTPTQIHLNFEINDYFNDKISYDNVPPFR
jgi:hypothetical protein